MRNSIVLSGCWALALGAGFTTFVTLPATAAPPVRSAGAQPAASALSAARPRAGGSGTMHMDAMHLDLRAPKSAAPAGWTGSPTLAAFPSQRRAQAWDQPDLKDQLPSLGAEAGGPVRTMGRAEEIVRRVHREGLPLARLWESHSTLVSLGLNGRGKPGLWLIQKVQ